MIAVLTPCALVLLLLMPPLHYSMCATAAFENVVQALYKYVVPKPRDQCTKSEQLTVSFAAGYIAGVFCAVVSHPAGERQRGRPVAVGAVAVGGSSSRL